MRNMTSTLLGLGLTIILSGCGDTCESVQDEIQSIGGEIREEGGNPWDREAELTELGDKLAEMGC